MWYVCDCGKAETRQPHRNSGYKRWLCDSCKSEATNVPIIKRRPGKLAELLDRPRSPTGRRHVT